MNTAIVARFWPYQHAVFGSTTQVSKVQAQADDADAGGLDEGQWYGFPKGYRPMLTSLKGAAEVGSFADPFGSLPQHRRETGRLLRIAGSLGNYGQASGMATLDD